MEITPDLVTKLLETVDAGLCSGVGSPKPGEMCVEAAVCYAMGLPHGDEPTCVGSDVRDFKIRLNDSSWSSNQARAAGMRKLAVAQLGSDQIDQRAFVDYVAEQTVRRLIPKLFRELNVCLDEADACERDDDWRLAIKKARDTADAAAANAANAANAAADAAADAAAYAAAYAADAAAYAAYANPEEYLLLSAEIGLEALVKLKNPGCEYLYLCN